MSRLFLSRNWGWKRPGQGHDLPHYEQLDPARTVGSYAPLGLGDGAVLELECHYAGLEGWRTVPWPTSAVDGAPLSAAPPTRPASNQRATPQPWAQMHDPWTASRRPSARTVEVAADAAAQAREAAAQALAEAQAAVHAGMGGGSNSSLEKGGTSFSTEPRFRVTAPRAPRRGGPTNSRHVQ
jgi:hypothetical protein